MACSNEARTASHCHGHTFPGEGEALSLLTAEPNALLGTRKY